MGGRCWMMYVGGGRDTCVCEGGGVFGREMGQCGYHGPLDQGLPSPPLPSLSPPLPSVPGLLAVQAVLLHHSLWRAASCHLECVLLCA